MSLRCVSGRLHQKLWLNFPFRKIDYVPEITRCQLGYIKKKPFENYHQWNIELETHFRKPILLSAATSIKKEITDPLLNGLNKIYLPTITTNILKVYQDIHSPFPMVDNRTPVSITDPTPSGRKPEKKFAHVMIRIRKRKMRKHKLRKLRKRMKFVFAKIKLKRELRKEQIFRTELLSQVEQSDLFDAKAYVEKILHTIRYKPKQETQTEIFERYRLLKKKNKYNTTFIRPRFDDLP